jgi:predicted AlkP superfamily phosphohydrolase/phosphomutase
MPTPRSDAPCRSHLARAWLGVAVLLLLTGVPVAQAYIGPGAGFAVGTTLFTLFVAVFSALGALLLWPFRWGLRAVRRRRAHAKARVRRVVVLGLDGLEPTLVEQYMAAGKLPNFARLRDQGTYLRLGTTAPPLTPVAWSSFMTGCNPGKHRIFDFLTRDPRTYRPVLSSVEIRPPRRQIRLGRYRLPLGPPQVRLLRKGRPFWNLLGDHGIFSNIIRMPITFPPEKFRGVLLSAMCVPDLRGSQGTFSYYTTGPAAEHIGGEQVHVQRDGDRIRAQLIGPADTVRPGNGPLRCPFEVRVTGRDAAVLKIDGQTYKLVSGRYTPWVRVPFKAGLGITVRGICEFLLLETHPEFRLYVTPIQLDPQSPALPLSHPAIYATYLAKLIGTYATLGLAEDTWGRNAGVLDDATFLHQCLEADEERMRMLADALDKVRQGFVACVLDGPDRVHHMFWRYLEPQHPARRPADAEADISRTRPHAIEEMYVRMDALVGLTLGQCRDPGTLLLVISDHGCASFRRGFDANRWLEEHGYLQLKPDGRGQKYLAGVDWSRTRAYALGLTGIWLNLRGREAQGIVDPADAAALRAELAGQLTGLRDPAADTVAIERVLDAQQIYRGPYREEAPDLVLGYAKGYRVSWEAAIGQPTEQTFHDNTKAWSGDHSIDPRHVPGVLFSNRRVQAERPHITDLAPTILTLFGVPVPAHMDGCPLEVADG